MDITVLTTILLGLWLFVVNNAPILAGLVLPPFIDVLNRDLKKESYKFFVAIFLAVGTACIFKWNDLAYGDPQAVLNSATLIFAESQVVYRFYFKKSALRAKLNPGTVAPVEATIPVQ